MAACDGSDGALPALPMPLGSYTVLLLAGPAGMPEIAELPAPAEPASGVVCASDNAGENTTNRPRARTADLWSIEVSFRGDQPGHAGSGSATCYRCLRAGQRKNWCRKQDSNL